MNSKAIVNKEQHWGQLKILREQSDHKKIDGRTN